MHGGYYPVGMMITVARCSTPEDAYLMRSRLEAGGVPAFVQNEYSAMTWGIGPFPEIRVEVPGDQIARAREILADNGIAPEDF